MSRQNANRRTRYTARYTALGIFLMGLVVATGAGLVWPSAPAWAQAAPQKIGTYRDWSAWIYRDGEQKVCFVTSEPKKSLPTDVRRGNIRFNVAHRPHLDIENEISMIVGYPFAKDKEAIAAIGGLEIAMQTEGERAWPRDPRDDNKLVRAMKGGLNMVVTGRSTRGTKTTDTYSLLGFTAAMNAIDKACP